MRVGGNIGSRESVEDWRRVTALSELRIMKD